MSKQNETKTLLIAFLLTSAVLVGGVWWVRESGILMGLIDSPNGPGTSPLGASRSAVALSGGEQLLLGGSSDLQGAVELIANRQYSQAVQQLEAFLQQNPNEPEALIYLNNARIAQGRSYPIAVAVPITGSENSAKEILRGVAQAQQEINQRGGINGVPLKVIIADDHNSPEMAQQVAEALVKMPEILAVVGHFSSDVSQAAAAIYQQQGLVMISPSSTSVTLSQAGNYIFRTAPSDAFTAKALAQYQLTELNLNQAVIFYNGQSDYSLSLKGQFTTELFTSGGSVLQEFDVSLPDFNPSEAVAEARQQGAEVLVLLTNTPTLDQALRVIQLNRQGLPLLGGDSLYNPRLLQVGAQDAQGMVVAVPWHILAHPDAPFTRTSAQLWRAEVNWRTAMAYDATQALIAALGETPTRSGVQGALGRSGFTTAGASEVIRFLPSGDRNQAVQLVEVVPGTRSGFGQDFNPIP
ncbi:ABC transporter substrate-binding protein [Spirulina subsalsa FACHB-351]|uniref:ABC transporter substrate-binding protein n=1 Tax=Spirulina subsalsa FACHB-351 TaxID=234711 RepID=A0ABT3L5F2_9CYAN|nr:ABC transporter substrate-binding protein [Spirulina subsalsa]MCW6036738.1 ABC transporter substrate-binding protein [Spirulina subsalsa FACHB-351]